MFLVALCLGLATVKAQNDNTNLKSSNKNDKIVQMRTNSTINEADLLKPIKDDIAKNFAEAVIVKAWKHDIRGINTYLVMINKDNIDWELTYDQDGKFINKEVSKKMENRMMEKQVPRQAETAPGKR